MASDRLRRVNEAVREVLSSKLTAGLKDPRIGFVTVTSVETVSDLSHAKVFVSVLGTEEEREETLEGLTASRGFLQAALGREFRMKRTPTLEFLHDPSVDHGFRIGELIEEQEQ
jgi:ribosome-binding factor A